MVPTVPLRGAFRRAPSDDWFAILFVMGPHPNDLHGLDVVKNLVHESMLNTDPTGTGSGQVADEFLIGWRGLIWIVGEEIKKLLCLGLQP
jgi:hypothetical protein